MEPGFIEAEGEGDSNHTNPTCSATAHNESSPTSEDPTSVDGRDETNDFSFITSESCIKEGIITAAYAGDVRESLDDITTASNETECRTITENEADCRFCIAGERGVSVVEGEIGRCVCQERAERDFSRLPELVWIQIFQLLSLIERYRLSQVNWFFNSLFHDPVTWRKGVISFTKVLVHGYFFVASYKLALSERDKKLTRKFGPFYRDVTLRVRGRPEEIEDDTRQILANLQSRWRLEALTLDIGDREWGNRYQGMDSVCPSLLLEVTGILKEVTSLRRLHIIHWPQCSLIDNDSLQLGEVLSAAECPKLRSLRLPRTSDNGVLTVNDPRSLAEKVSGKFLCLHHLYLSSDMLSDNLFLGLRRSPLRSLSVDIRGYWSTGILNHLLTPLDWSGLTAALPRLGVKVVVTADVPEFALQGFLVPQIPLVEVTFDINCHCYRKAFVWMHQYSDTLRSFRCFSRPSDCELELVDMIRQCQRIRILTFHGTIADYNVLKLTQSANRKWLEFVFLWRYIEKTTQRPTPFNLVSRSLARAVDANLDPVMTEEEVKAEFCRQVSEKLGFSWEPSPSEH